MKLEENAILMNQSFKNKIELIEATGQLLFDNGYVEKDYIQSMKDRENTVSTYMGNLICIPHGTDEGRKYIKKTGISIVQIPDGVDFGGGDKPVKVAFGIAGVGDEHLDLLSKIAIFCSEVENVEKIVSATSKQEIINMLEAAEA